MTLKPYKQLRKDFKEALEEQLKNQGPITKKAIKTLQQSRKYISDEEKQKILNDN